MKTYKELKDIFESVSQFVIYRSSDRKKLATVVGFEAAKNKARQVRKSLGLKFDDIKFMTTNRYESGYKKSVTKQGWRIEKSPYYNPSKGGYFRVAVDPRTGNTADID